MSSHSHSEDVSHLPPPVVVTTPSQLEALLDDLSTQPAIAVDTESNSLYAYYEQVCLIQCSVPGTDYIVDPLAGLDLSPLGRFFADPRMRKVFHAAEYDVMCLKRDFDFRFANLFFAPLHQPDHTVTLSLGMGDPAQVRPSGALRHLNAILGLPRQHLLAWDRTVEIGRWNWNFRIQAHSDFQDQPQRQDYS